MSKILIVEDEEVLRDVYREEFESEGFTVEIAKDGQEGVERMVSFLPEIVLLDLYMPKLSGFDVLNSVKENLTLKKIPIIVLTNINSDVADLMKNWGVAYFLLKADNTPGQVVQRVRMILDNKK